MNGESYVLKEKVALDTSIYGCSFNGVYKKVGDPSSMEYCFKELDLASGGYSFQCASTTASSTSSSTPFATTTGSGVEEKVSKEIDKIIGQVQDFINSIAGSPEAEMLSNVLKNFRSIQDLLQRRRAKRSPGE